MSTASSGSGVSWNSRCWETNQFASAKTGSSLFMPRASVALSRYPELSRVAYRHLDFQAVVPLLKSPPLGVPGGGRGKSSFRGADHLLAPGLRGPLGTRPAGQSRLAPCVCVPTDLTRPGRGESPGSVSALAPRTVVTRRQDKTEPTGGEGRLISRIPGDRLVRPVSSLNLQLEGCPPQPWSWGTSVCGWWGREH